VVEQPLADIEKKEEEVSKKKADEKRSILRDAADEAPTSATRKVIVHRSGWITAH
jgi:hypothetical protein